MKDSKIYTMFQIIKHKNCSIRKKGKIVRYSLKSQDLHFDMHLRLSNKIDRYMKYKKYQHILAILKINQAKIRSNFDG